MVQEAEKYASEDEQHRKRVEVSRVLVALVLSFGTVVHSGVVREVRSTSLTPAGPGQPGSSSFKLAHRQAPWKAGQSGPQACRCACSCCPSWSALLACPASAPWVWVPLSAQLVYESSHLMLLPCRPATAWRTTPTPCATPSRTPTLPASCPGVCYGGGGGPLPEERAEQARMDLAGWAWCAGLLLSEGQCCLTCLLCISLSQRHCLLFCHLARVFEAPGKLFSLASLHCQHLLFSSA